MGIRDNPWELKMFMKKLVCFVILCVILFLGFNGNSVIGNSVSGNENEQLQKSISSKIIRFHVIANSDSAEDQALKLAVRDKILEFIYPKLKLSKSIDESRKILQSNDGAIKAIAEKVIKEKGYNYNVVSTLSQENFPVKVYGNITLPQGRYEAYRVIIGNGKGQNWWCVMFPPLCFIDVTKGEVAYKETEGAMKKVLSKDEYETIDNQSKTKEVKIKFKVVEIFQNIKDKVKIKKS